MGFIFISFTLIYGSCVTSHIKRCELSFYTEWQVGTRPGGSDIFPPLIVGVNSSGSAAIVDGQLVLNSLSTNKTLSEFQTLVSGSIDDIGSEQNETHTDNTFFSLEPGRCSHHTMTAVGWSHLKSALKSKSVCIKSKIFFYFYFIFKR